MILIARDAQSAKDLDQKIYGVGVLRRVFEQSKSFDLNVEVL